MALLPCFNIYFSFSLSFVSGLLYVVLFVLCCIMLFCISTLVLLRLNKTHVFPFSCTALLFCILELQISNDFFNFFNKNKSPPLLFVSEISCKLKHPCTEYCYRA